MAWRQRLIDSGQVSRTSFKEAHLRLVLRSGQTDVDNLRAMLPGAVADHAEELASMLAALPEETGSAAATGISGRHQAAVPPPAAAADEMENTTMFRAGAAPAPPRRAEPATFGAGDFAEFTYGDTPGEVHPATPRRLRDSSGKPAALELTWPPHLPQDSGAESVVIYRVVSGDDTAPYSPDRSDLVATGTATSARDDRPFTTALRHFQVWVNVGGTHAAALAAQPFKHAETALVSPVRDFGVREDGGQVIGQWSVSPAVQSVFVYRVPAAERDRVGPQHRILAESDNRTGFVDTTVARGERYRYVVRAAAPVDGVLRLSEGAEADVEISAVLAPVTDLTLRQRPGEESTFELSWTPPPAGRVVVYRSQRGPNAGSEAAELPEVALEQIGLTPDLRLTQPVGTRSDDAGLPRTVMTGVSWPTAWSRAYLTPVTLLAGRALLGKTLSSVRTGVIRDVDLAEYCNKQVLTFDWPAGATAVEMHVAPKGYDPRDGLTGKSREITEEEYEKYGGLQLSAQELPVAGCSLHLAPVAFSGGRRVAGAIRSIEYAGLLRLQYAMQIHRDPEGQATHAHIAMRSQYDLPGSPAFVLVNNRDRIPLSANDGDAVDAAPLTTDGRLADQPSKELRWSALTTQGNGELWAANLRGREGWIRLFVNSPSPERLRTIALLDPPVETLRLTAGRP